MTFEEYMKQEVGFGNFTREELLRDNYLNMKLYDWIDEMYKAYTSGLDTGYNQGFKEAKQDKEYDV